MATKKEMVKQGFLLYHEDMVLLGEVMTPDQIGRLVLAINWYSMTGERPELDADIAGVFALIAAKIRKQEEQYEKATQQRKAASDARWGKNRAEVPEEGTSCEVMRNDANASETMRPHAPASKSDANVSETMQTETETETVYPLLQYNNNNNARARGGDDPFAIDAQLDQMQGDLGCSDADREVLRRLCNQYPPDQVIRAVTYARKDGAKATVLDAARILRVWKQKDEAGDAFDWAVQGGGT